MHRTHIMGAIERLSRALVALSNVLTLEFYVADRVAVHNDRSDISESIAAFRGVDVWGPDTQAAQDVTAIGIGERRRADIAKTADHVDLQKRVRNRLSSERCESGSQVPGIDKLDHCAKVEAQCRARHIWIRAHSITCLRIENRQPEIGGLTLREFTIRPPIWQKHRPACLRLPVLGFEVSLPRDEPGAKLVTFAKPFRVLMTIRVADDRHELRRVIVVSGFEL
jgi:hypothetical protein